MPADLTSCKHFGNGSRQLTPFLALLLLSPDSRLLPSPRLHPSPATDAPPPPEQEKRFWRRYIYLWINYAVYEELEARDMERARQVYRAALELTPHKHFTFAKLWLMYAHFEIRQKELTAARRALVSAGGGLTGGAREDVTRMIGIAM